MRVTRVIRGQSQPATKSPHRRTPMHRTDGTETLGFRAPARYARLQEKGAFRLAGKPLNAT